MDLRASELTLPNLKAISGQSLDISIEELGEHQVRIAFPEKDYNIVKPFITSDLYKMVGYEEIAPHHYIVVKNMGAKLTDAQKRGIEGLISSYSADLSSVYMVAWGETLNRISHTQEHMLNRLFDAMAELVND